MLRCLDYETSLKHGVSVGINSQRNTLFNNQRQLWSYRNTAETTTVDSILPKIRPSPSIKFFNQTEVSNQRYSYSMESNAVPNEHEFVRPDEPTKITNNSKSPLSNLTTAFRYIPEDSCDSVVSIDDVDDDEDEDDVADAPGKSLNKIFQGPSPGNNCL